MKGDPYLIRLGNRLGDGLSRMDTERQNRHRLFIASQLESDGGFSGREGDSDLYYSSFAIRGLATLGCLTAETCESITPFLRSHAPDQLSIIDLVSWLYSALIVEAVSGTPVLVDADSGWVESLTEMLESVRTNDGGYAKTTAGAAGSTYHSFLVALTYELIGRQVPNPNALIQFLYDRQRDDGGFVEIEPMKRSGTNPTAAAVALLTIFDALDDELRDDVHAFLRDVSSDEGAFQANTRIPFADGLSTFTALLTAQDLGFDDLVDASRIEDFVSNQLEFPSGGFRGAEWDEQADVEYTFYGLGILGLLWSNET